MNGLQHVNDLRILRLTTKFCPFAEVIAVLKPCERTWNYAESARMFIPSDDLHKMFKDCNTKLVITIPELSPKVKKAISGLQDIRVSTCRLDNKYNWIGHDNKIKLHYENTPIQIYRKFYHPKKKNENFQIKNSDIFLISAQNIDCGLDEAVLTSIHNLYFEQK